MWLKKVNMFQLLNEFNRLFQNEESNVSVLIPEMDRTLRKFLINFVLARHIRDVVDLHTVDFTDRTMQHDDPMFAVSLKGRSFYADNDSTGVEQAAFAKEVRAFYCAFVTKMVAKFPFW